jgi:predicted phage terminase large subunit-like protein
MPTVLTSKKSQRDDATKAGIRFLAITDLYSLSKVLLNHERPAEQNFLTDGFHRPLCDFVQTTPYAINLYLIQRGGLKTSLLTVARNVQRILKNPQIRILIASNKADNADAMLAEIKNHLLNPLLLWLFPDVLWQDPARQAEKWTTSAITVKVKRRAGASTVEAIGMEGEITSKHYEHITFDDLVGEKNSQTREQVLATVDWWKKSQGLAMPGTTQDIIGTPWHPNDLYLYLQEQRDKQGMPLGIYKQPCWVPDDDGDEVPGHGKVRATLPEMWPLPKLLEVRRVQGSAVFAAQRLLDPIDDETAVFPRKSAVIRPRDKCPPLDELWCAMTIDPAISTKAWADYSAIAVCGFDRSGVMHVLDLRHGKWSEGKLVDEIYDAFGKTPGIRAVGFEAIAFAKIYRREFTRAGEQRGTFLPITTLERDTRTTKNVRIRALSPFWEHGEIILYEDLLALEDFLDEAQRFRLYREATHDDMLDCLADQMQLRSRPSEKDHTPEWMLDDPVLMERQAADHYIMGQRAKLGLPPLDATSLKVARNMHLWHKRIDEEKEAMALDMGADEFYR